jgi:hypothetical protein
MTSKAYSSKFAIKFGIFSFIVSTFLEILAICLLINGLINHQKIIFEVLIIFVFLPPMLFSLFMTNRFGYFVIYDASTKTLYRKGAIVGYKCQVKIDDIQDVVVMTFPKETTYYVIVDSFHNKYDGGYITSFIRIEKTEQNLNFINQFWSEPIKETKNV